MDHQQAVQIQAAERYLLEELSPEERDGFEEHYFMCVACANEVRAAFTFADNAKAVMVEERQERPAPARTAVAARQPGWWTWFRPSFAMPALAALLLGVTLYQSLLVIPRLERGLETATAPRVIPSTVARAATRGEGAAVQLAPEDQFVQVILDITPAVPVSSYTVEVYNESGSVRFAVPAPAPRSGESLNLLLPAPALEPGRYTVRVRSQGGSVSMPETQSDEYNFAVQRR